MLFFLDVHKFDEWKVLIESDLKSMEWMETDSESESDDEDDEEEDEEEMDED